MPHADSLLHPGYCMAELPHRPLLREHPMGRKTKPCPHFLSEQYLGKPCCVAADALGSGFSAGEDGHIAPAMLKPSFWIWWETIGRIKKHLPASTVYVPVAGISNLKKSKKTPRKKNPEVLALKESQFQGSEAEVANWKQLPKNITDCYTWHLSTSQGESAFYITPCKYHSPFLLIRQQNSSCLNFSNIVIWSEVFQILIFFVFFTSWVIRPDVASWILLCTCKKTCRNWQDLTIRQNFISGFKRIIICDSLIILFNFHTKNNSYHITRCNKNGSVLFAVYSNRQLIIFSIYQKFPKHNECSIYYI